MKKNIIILLLLSNFNLFSQKLIPYRKGNLWGYSDVNKTIIVKPEFDKVTYFIENKAGIVVKNKKVGLMSAKGEILIPVQYKYIKIDEKGYTAILDTGDIYYDENFKKIDSPVEPEPMEVSQPYEFSEANGKKGLIGKTPIYDNMFEFKVDENRYFIVLKESKYGVISESETIIIPFIYDFLSNIDNINITKSNSTLLTGIGKNRLNEGSMKFDRKYGLHSIFLDNNSKLQVYLEPKYDLEKLPNTNQYIDDDGYVCISKDGKEHIWNIKTGIHYYDE